MSSGIKNLQAHARAHARRERLETGGMPLPYDDDSGIDGFGLTPVDDDMPSYSSPEDGGGSSSHSTSSSSTAYSASQHHHHRPPPHHMKQQQQQQHDHHHHHHHPQGDGVPVSAASYPGYYAGPPSNGYNTPSVSSMGTAQGGGPGSPYMGRVGINSIINGPRRSIDEIPPQ